MKYLMIFAVTVVIMTGCTTQPPVSNGLSFGYGINDCLIQAVTMTEALRKVGVKADVLSMDGVSYGHAVCRYVPNWL